MLKIPLLAMMFVMGVFFVQRSSSLVAVEILWLIFFLLSAFVFACWVFLRVKPCVRHQALCDEMNACGHHSSLSPSLPTTKSILHASLNAQLKTLCFTITVCCIGFLWASMQAHMRLQHALPKALEKQAIEVVGVIASSPQPTQFGWRFKFDIETVEASLTTAQSNANETFPKRVLLNFYPNQKRFSSESNLAARPVAVTPPKNSQPPLDLFKVGERWQMTASFKKNHSTMNPHGFDFEAWAMSERLDASGTVKHKKSMAKLDYFVWQPKYMVERARADIQNYIQSVLKTDAHVGLLEALVMGDQSRISPEDWQVMLNTGTTHLMSISGLHISMLAGLMFSLSHFCWRRLPNLALRFPARKAATVIAMLTALSYALIAGFSIPTQRTLYMLIVFAIALWSSRQFVISQVLSIALIVVVIIDPWSVISAGFWLSFGAVAFLAYGFAGRIGTPSWLNAFLVSQWLITLGLMPVLLVLFNQISVVSPIANAIAIPLISFIVTPLALVGGFLHIDFLLHISHFFIEIGMVCLDFLSQQPYALWHQQAPPSWTLWPAIFGALWLLLPKGFPLKWMGCIGFLPIMCIMPMQPAFGAMKVTVLDVSQGLSVVVQTHRHTFLYDAGNRYSAQNDAGKSVIVPFLRAEGIRQLDGLMISHQDTDHVGGLASVLSSIPTKWLSTSFDANPYVDFLKLKPVLFHCNAKQSWHWEGVDFEVLYPMSTDDLKKRISIKGLSTNDQSCVLKITSHYGSILLTGDIEKYAELALLNNAKAKWMMRSDVMVAPHHGSKTSSRRDFIQAVSPSAAIFTVGYLNRYRHPNPEVMARYDQSKMNVYRSDYDGGISLNFDAPTSIRISTARNDGRRYWHQVFSPSIEE